jgi:CopG family transcriptional regulator/antitoxin EndoAI
MSKRINIVLPDQTLSILDRVATKGNRSRLISRAILDFIESQGKATLRERLKREALANAERDVEMAAEWFALQDPADSLSKKHSKSRKRKIA